MLDFSSELEFARKLVGMCFYLLLEWKGAIFVRVEETDELVELALTNAVNVVVLEEGDQLETAEAAACIAIDSLEGGVRRKISDLAKSLAETL